MSTNQKVEYPSWFEVKVKIIHYFGSVKSCAEYLAINSKSFRDMYESSVSTKRQVAAILKEKEKQSPICKFARIKVKGGEIKKVRLVPNPMWEKLTKSDISTVKHILLKEADRLQKEHSMTDGFKITSLGRRVNKIRLIAHWKLANLQTK